MKMNAYQGDKSQLRVLFWGTYDLGKPRVRLLLRGLKAHGIETYQIHGDVWQGIEDKSQVKGIVRKLGIGARWLFSYPGLLWRYFHAPTHDVVVIGYLGLADILVIWPFARLMRKPILLDAFLSMYNTVVEDRRIVAKSNPVAKLLWFVEWLGCHAADHLITDTRAHGQYFIDTYNLRPEKVGTVLVGVEPEAFYRDDECPNTGAARGTNRLKVLFYGQFIPLHGIETIIEAARICHDSGIEWRLIGRGQEADRILRMLEQGPVSNLSWLEWVPYEDLVTEIAKADICLGIFGRSEKAARVIPNKVFQILAANKPLITADTPAIRELLSEQNYLALVPPADPEALCKAVKKMAERIRDGNPSDVQLSTHSGYMPQDIGENLAKQLRAAMTDRHP